MLLIDTAAIRSRLSGPAADLGLDTETVADLLNLCDSADRLGTILKNLEGDN